MLLRELVENSAVSVISSEGGTEIEITDVVYDSRQVTPGALYVAIPGTKAHGDSFIEQARQAGARAIVSENPHEGLGVPWVQVANPRQGLGMMGRCFFGVDLTQMTTIGITGTNGKTTTAYLMKHLLDKHVGPEHGWMFGTTGNVLGAKRFEATHTTPESIDIFRLMSQVTEPPRGLVMEVSSHSLALDRVAGMEFDLGVWTNLTQDHLDFHGTMEDYYTIKKRLFTQYLKPAGCAIINVDDEYGRRLAGELADDCRVVTFGHDNADVLIEVSKCSWSGIRMVLTYDNQTYRFTAPLTGEFNLSNLTAMLTAGFVLDMDVMTLEKVAATAPGVPGRMEVVDIHAPFTVVVDYAHTPDALINILSTASALTTERVICMFSCGGDRDRTKRPIMGRAVAEHCDYAVVTSDNPRSEDPEQIIAEILPGMTPGFGYEVVPDRREAIRTALTMARPGDCVIIAGKGHETFQEIQGVRHHFDDREEVVTAWTQITR
ncbi:MAG: UDP-N-acetylmuramoyl-L-alanyl-D-glutamate--2,6-diaminopimelate ligase [Propionibacteriaceae bacterium]|nr:UDP-N-acetylmuramoyl-L-alanyl-D-glutamate--2,6-diaminopimelate ligase [Propionibacteriaceae bacterium]